MHFTIDCNGESLKVLLHYQTLLQIEHATRQIRQPVYLERYSGLRYIIMDQKQDKTR